MVEQGRNPGERVEVYKVKEIVERVKDNKGIYGLVRVKDIKGDCYVISEGDIELGQKVISNLLNSGLSDWRVVSMMTGMKERIFRRIGPGTQVKVVYGAAGEIKGIGIQ